MLKKVFEGSVNYLQVLDENGNVNAALLPKGLDDNRIVEMYKYMSFTSAVDAKCMSLQRQGRLQHMLHPSERRPLRSAAPWRFARTTSSCRSSGSTAYFS